MNETLSARLRSARATVRVGYPWWLQPLLHRSVWAITVGRRIWIHPRVAELGVEVLEATIRHELVHVDQYRRDGMSRFVGRYIREYIAGRRSGLSHHEAYRAISYEREAWGDGGACEGENVEE